MAGRARVLITALAVLSSIGGLRAETDLAAMTSDDIAALQRRLADAGCYRGTIDGAASGDTAEALKACPPMDPILRIETGMHTAPVWSVAADRDCRILATGSDDKTVRLWSVAERRLLRVERLPLAAGSAGKVTAVAVSPDGKLVAAALRDPRGTGEHAYGLYLFDVATGQKVHRVGQFARIGALDFSPDGKRLALIAGGLHIVNVDGGGVVAGDFDDREVASVARFAEDGSLFAVSARGMLRRYDRQLKLTAETKITDGSFDAIAVDPSGRYLAVGYGNTPTASIYRADGLGHVAELDLSRTVNDEGQVVVIVANAYPSKLTWIGPEGDPHLAVGGAGKSNFIRFFNAKGRQIGSDAVLPPLGSISTLATCGNSVAFALTSPVFGLVSSDRRIDVLGERTLAADTIGAGGLAVSSSGALLGFALDTGKPVQIDLEGETVAATGKRSGGATALPITSGIPVIGWHTIDQPTLRGSPLLPKGEVSQALAVRADRTGFLLATLFALHAYDAAGKELWSEVAPAPGQSVNLANGGKLVLASYADGTIRWYRWSDGEELLALLVDRQGKRWIAATPSGYYMASPGGEDLIGWHVNRGWDQPADFFPASRFREKFNRPDIVKLVLTTLDEGRAVEEANAAGGKQRAATSLTQSLPPVISIYSPGDGDRFTGSEAKIIYAVRSPSGAAVDRIDVLVDGRPVGTPRGVERADAASAEAVSLPEAATVGSSTAGKVVVLLPNRDVTVSLIARTGDLVSAPASIRLSWGGPGADLLKPKLYGLVVGVSRYADAALALKYAAKDATDFAAALRGQGNGGGGLYAAIEVKVLTDGDATRDNIMDGLDWLRRTVTGRDIGIVYLAGHGMTDEAQEFWFLPVAATPENLASRGVAKEDIQRTLDRLAGKAILFLDACHSASVTAGARPRGTVEINPVINDFASAEHGVITFSSSLGREVSLERADWGSRGNGAFTAALVEGLGDGKADLLGSGRITLSELDAYVVNRVGQLTNGLQHPVMTRPNTVSDFPIGIADR